MFTSSVRRAAFAAQPSPIAASISAAVPRAAASQTLSCRPTQRRYSSSKPSNADGPKGVVSGSPSVPAPAARAEAKKSKGKGGRKAKDIVDSCTVKARDEAFQNLPSVPSTAHVQGKEIAASAFFSLFRPISVTLPFPKTITEDSFASIFAPRRITTNDVISTLSSSVQKLELGGAPAWNNETDQLRAALMGQQEDIHHLDGNPNDAIPFPQHILSRYQPFNPPPPPIPMNEVESADAAVEAAEASEPQHRTYTATLTVEESIAANGEVTYVAHSSPLIVEEPSIPARFLDRMNIRQRKWNEYRERRGEEMHAISVKRQRKLKMKKHKYKKLMRRTRNLRRRLDRN